VSKSLAVCCDGTWDRPVERHSEQRTCTNVYKLWRGIADENRSGDPQRTFYHEGVGTGGRLDHIFGGVFGSGLARNVLGCYRFLALNYAPGDRIYLFGFSRGAYTARSTAGMVRNCGLLRHENLDRLADAFRLYRDRGEDTSPASERARKFRDAYAHDARVHFIGVWDTVGSLGVPVPIPFFKPWWAFHDTDLSSTVLNAYHAIAIDEQRAPFKPTLWTRPTEPPEQVLEQVWFAGCHRDVGGGEPRPDLADVTLRWMVTQAQKCGLGFAEDHFQYAAAPDELRRFEGRSVHPDPDGDIHQSRRGVWTMIPAAVRAITYGGPEPSYRFSDQSVSSTAASRTRQYPPPQLLSYLSGEHQTTDVPLETIPTAQG
jgi:uncharacterized protein (DUF2235 family)